MTQQSASCLRLLRQTVLWAFCFALLRAGRSIPARIAMIAITTSNSIRVNASARCGSGLWIRSFFGTITDESAQCVLLGFSILNLDKAVVAHETHETHER